MGKAIGICPKCGKKIEIGTFDRITGSAKTGLAILKKILGNAGKAGVKTTRDSLPKLIDIRRNTIGENISEKDAKLQGQVEIFNALVNFCSNFYDRTDHVFKHLGLQALSDLHPKCDHCGYKWTLFDTIKLKMDEIDERVKQTGDFSRYIDYLPKLIGFLEGNNDDDDIKSLISNFKLKMRDLWTPDEDGNSKYQFTKQKPYFERKAIFVAKSFHDVTGFIGNIDSINYIFTPDCIPSDIRFPLGGPNVNSLYIVNPVKPDEYLPYENYELELFKDKIRELMRLLRSLGATEITFTSLRGIKLEEIAKEITNIHGEVGAFNHEIRGGRSLEYKDAKFNDSNQQLYHIERLDLPQYPSKPDGLHWYDSDPLWKDLVEARLKLNQLHFEQKMSTRQVASIDKQSKKKIDAEYKNLLFGIYGEYQDETDSREVTSEETEWCITAEFKPISEFENTKEKDSEALLSSGNQDNINTPIVIPDEGEVIEYEYP